MEERLGKLIGLWILRGAREFRNVGGTESEHCVRLELVKKITRDVNKKPEHFRFFIGTCNRRH